MEALGSHRKSPKKRGHFLRFRGVSVFCNLSVYVPYVFRDLGCVMVRPCLFEFLRLATCDIERTGFWPVPKIAAFATTCTTTALCTHSTHSLSAGLTKSLMQ